MGQSPQQDARSQVQSQDGTDGCGHGEPVQPHEGWQGSLRGCNNHQQHRGLHPLCPAAPAQELPQADRGQSRWRPADEPARLADLLRALPLRHLQGADRRWHADHAPEHLAGLRSSERLGARPLLQFTDCQGREPHHRWRRDQWTAGPQAGPGRNRGRQRPRS